MYANGEVPTSLLLQRPSAGKDPCLMMPGTAAKHDRLVQLGAAYGWVPLVSGPADAYRRLAVQESYWNSMPSGQAAYPGTSSHGGTFDFGDGAVEQGAVDYGNWYEIGWDLFQQLTKQAGFVPGVFIGRPGIPDEYWHVFDPSPWDAVAGNAVSIATSEGDDMYIIRAEGRTPTLVGPGYVRALNDEEAGNIGAIVSKDSTVNPRQFDLAVSAATTGTVSGPNSGPFVAYSTNRPKSLFAPGFVRALNKEEADNAASLFSNRVFYVNDRQFDLARSVALTGEMPKIVVEATPPKAEPPATGEKTFAVDISHWQTNITPTITKQWAAAGINHGIVKMGGGNSGIYESSTHRVQVAALRAAGIPASRYWFNGRDASISSQVWAARAQLDTTPLADGERFMWDVENEGTTARWTPAEVVDAAQRLSDLVPYSRQVVYLGSAATREADWSSVVELGLQLMVADYGANDGTRSSTPLVGFWPRDKVWIWQYTSTGRLPGYDGDLDLSTGDLRNLWTVRDLQEALNKTGANLVVDGDYRELTTAAVVAFQTANGLKPDGDAGPITLAKLAEVAG
jgi:GH25 family lysozyme M1 (1,4-beta-N-acetylmuramidase)